jgi:D-threo-aldose 1-dehydrogenase
MISFASSSTTNEANRAGRSRALSLDASIEIIIWCDDMSRLAFGTAPLGGLFGAVSDETARATVDAAWSVGIRHFDTAPLYGSGLAASRLGTALAGRPRDEYTISTKVGRVLVPGEPDPHFAGAPPLTPVFDFSAAAVRRCLAESMRRLQQERIDVALLHDPEQQLDDARRAIEIVRELVPAVGVGTNVVATAQRLVERGEIDVVLLAGRYTLLDRSAGDDLLPLCAERGVPVLAAGVFNSGVLAGGDTFDYETAPPAIVGRARELGETCARHGVPLAAAAVQFPARHPAVASVLVGCSAPAHVDEDVRLATLDVPDALWDELA